MSDLIQSSIAFRILSCSVSPTGVEDASGKLHLLTSAVLLSTLPVDIRGGRHGRSPVWLSTLPLPLGFGDVFAIADRRWRQDG